MLFVYSVGGHFNPKNTRHGSPDDKENERVCFNHIVLSGALLCTELNIVCICLGAPKLCYSCCTLLSTVKPRFNVPAFSEIPDLVMIFSCPNNSSI
jgi:hypothetical protein